MDGPSRFSFPPTWWPTLSRRIWIAIGVSTGTVLLLVWFGLNTASAARDARAEVEALLEQVGGNSASSLLEPSTYALLLDQVASTQTSLDDLDSRLALFGALRFVPIIGGRVNDARNTVSLGKDISLAAASILRVFGGALEAQQVGDNITIEEDQEALVSALAALDRAEQLVSAGTVLSERQQILVASSIEILQNLVIVALEAPDAVAEGFRLLSTVDRLQYFFADPFLAIAQSTEVRQSLGRMTSSIQAIQAQLAALSPDRQERISIAQGAVEVVLAASGAASDLLAVSDALDLGALSPEFGTAVGGRLAAARLQLQQARAQLVGLAGDRAFQEEPGSDGLALGSGHPLAPAEQLLVDAIDAVELANEALGYEGARRYLIVMQNQNEIRATGGFIGATAELTLRNGVMAPLVFEDSTRIDIPPLTNNPPAPEPIYWYLWIARLLFRDANFEISFDQSAQTLIGMYESSKRVDLDGAVAGTKLLALDLLDVVGSIQVPSINQPVNRALAELYVEKDLPFACTSRHISTKGKRCFDEDLVRGIIDKLQDGVDEAGRVSLITTVLRHLERKNILVYSESPNLQSMLVGNGWAGIVQSPAQDFLMVVDSSLPGHTKALVNREIDYRVQLVPSGESVADLRVRFVNRRTIVAPDCRQAVTASGEDNVDCYWNYVRVLLPPAANVDSPPVAALSSGMEKLIWGYRDLDSAELLVHAGSGLTNMQEIGAFIVAEPSTVATLPIAYTLDESVIRQVGSSRYSYALALTKQPGIDDDVVTVRLKLPVGATLVARSPASIQIVEGVATWSGVLLEDTELVVEFETN